MQVQSIAECSICNTFDLIIMLPFVIKIFVLSVLDWPQSLMSFFFSKTDNLSKIAFYKLYLEVEVLGLDIRI